MQLKRIFMIPKDYPDFEEHKACIDAFVPDDKRRMNILVEPEQVQAWDIDFIHTLVMVLQHYPEKLSNFVFRFNFQFPIEQGGNQCIPLLEWSKDINYVGLFSKMSHTPYMVYFLGTRATRFFCLLGDDLGEMQVSNAGQDASPEFELTGDILDRFINRALEASVFFFVYNFKSTYNCKPAIEALIKEFDLPFTYGKVYNRAMEFLKAGETIRIKVPGPKSQDPSPKTQDPNSKTQEENCEEKDSDNTGS